MKRKIKKQNVNFAEQLECVRDILKETILMFFKNVNISPGCLFEAKKNNIAVINTTSEDFNIKPTIISTIHPKIKKSKVSTTHKKYPEILIRTGNIGVFLDVMCEIIDEDIVYVAASILYDNKIVNIGSDVIDINNNDEEKLSCNPSSFVASILKSWKPLKTDKNKV